MAVGVGLGAMRGCVRTRGLAGVGLGVGRGVGNGVGLGVGTGVGRGVGVGVGVMVGAIGGLGPVFFHGHLQPLLPSSTAPNTTIKMIRPVLICP